MHSRAWPFCGPRYDEAVLQHQLHCGRRSNVSRHSQSELPQRMESKTWRDLPRLSAFEFQRIFAARETSCLRCNEPSASRNLALGTTGIEVQGYLETTQNERFNDASDFGTSLTLAAPAAGYRDPTPSSTLDKRALGTLMRKATFSQFFKTKGRKTHPTSRKQAL